MSVIKPPITGDDIQDSWAFNTTSRLEDIDAILSALNIINWTIEEDSEGNLKFYKNGSEKFSLSEDGALTLPETPHWYGGLTRTASINGYADSHLDVEKQGGMKSVDGKIYVPEDGIYLMTANTIDDGIGTRADIYFDINGSASNRVAKGLSNQSTISGNHHSLSNLSVAVKLNANDYWSVYNSRWYDNTSTTSGSYSWRKFSITKIG